jgi:hypothetical protein
MKMSHKPLAAALLVAALGATAPPALTISPSNLGFTEALGQCPAGTLGAITIALGHVRVTAAPGIESDIDDANPNAQTVTLAGRGKSATATVNASAHTVAAKHLSPAARRRVACVAPE